MILFGSLLKCGARSSNVWGVHSGSAAHLHRMKPVKAYYLELGGDLNASPEHARGLIYPILLRDALGLPGRSWKS